MLTMTNGVTVADFEQAIILTGYGRFHYALAACCAITLMSVGVQNGLNAYILPVAQCDLNLTSAEMGYLNISFLIGGICSAFLWGLLGDLVGRRKVLIYTLLSDWLVTICAGLSQTFLTLAIFRFLNGFLIGAPGTLIYSYYAEFQPERIRTKAVCFIGIFFTVAWLLLPALAWVIMPLPWEFRNSGFIFNSWRLFIIILSLPSCIAGFWLLTFPESPKFLLARGESKQALNILKHMFSINTNHTPDHFPVKYLLEEVCLQEVIDNKNNVKSVGRGRTARIMHEAIEQVLRLFQKPLLPLTLLTSLMLFSNVFGYLGLGLWLPEILSRFEVFNTLYPDDKITLCEIQDYFQEVKPVNFYSNESFAPLLNLTKYTSVDNETPRCENSMDETVFMNTLIMGACCLVGNILSSYLAGILNRKILPICTMTLGAISAAGIYWLNTSLQHLIVASVFQASMATANIVLNGVVVDLFPTSVSAMAVCTATLAGRFGAVVSNLVLGLLFDQSCEVPLLVIVIALACGALLGFFIPSENEHNKSDDSAKEHYKSLSDLSIITLN